MKLNKGFFVEMFGNLFIVFVFLSIWVREYRFELFCTGLLSIFLCLAINIGKKEKK